MSFFRNIGLDLPIYYDAETKNIEPEYDDGNGILNDYDPSDKHFIWNLSDEYIKKSPRFSERDRKGMIKERGTYIVKYNPDGRCSPKCIFFDTGCCPDCGSGNFEKES